MTYKASNTGKVERVGTVWPLDTESRIRELRSKNIPWWKVGLSFGVTMQVIRAKAKELGILDPTKNRRFTPEDDAYIRENFVKGVDLHVMAAHLNRSWGTLRQRIQHYHHDLINATGRTPKTIGFKNKYGLEWPDDPNAVEPLVDELKKQMRDAAALARKAVIDARVNRVQQQLKQMQAELDTGGNRNEIIFNYRATGLTLNDIADVLRITRERVRQIFDKEAYRRALELIEKQNAQTVPSPVAEPGNEPNT